MKSKRRYASEAELDHVEHYIVPEQQPIYDLFILFSNTWFGLLKYLGSACGLGSAT